MKKTQAQGTIEYLVIIGIIIVIGLVTVSLATNFLDSGSQINNTTGNIKSTIGQGGISITEAVTDTQGDSLLTLKNNTSEKLTLTSITPLDASGNAGTPENYNKTIHYNETITFSYPTNTDCICSGTEKTKTCNYEIELTSQYGITKKEKITINVDCVTNSEPIKPPISPLITDCFNLSENPTQICSLSDLNRIREDLTANYILMNNIDASETINWNNGDGFEPISGEFVSPSYTYFDGNFNGNNKTISNIYIYNPNRDYVGLFGFVTGDIYNTNLVDYNITGQDDVGGLIGHLRGSVQNCQASGIISGHDYIGGLIGSAIMNGTITESNTNVQVSGRYKIGGITGWLNNATMKDSFSIGTINGSASVGGLIGQSEGGSTISESYSNANITANQAGGLIGIVYNSTITNVYSTGNINKISNNYDYGGLIGSASTSTTITNAFSTGSVSGYNYVGGLVGEIYNNTTINNSFATGNVTGTINFGGLLGNNGYDSIVTNSYWDTYLTNQANCIKDSNTGCTPTNNEIVDYYGESGVLKLGNDGNWTPQENDYPKLAWE